jgi:hypothetical protein
MARPLRIDFEGAIYHVTARGIPRVASGKSECHAGNDPFALSISPSQP